MSTPLLPPLGKDSDADGLATSFSDLFLNLAITLMVPGLLAVSELATLELPVAVMGTMEQAPERPPLITRYNMTDDGTLVQDDTPLALAELDPADRVIAVFPANVGYGQVAHVLRTLDALTDAKLSHVEYSE